MDIKIITNKTELPAWLSLDNLISFLHHNMIPYEDQPQDIEKGLAYAFSDAEGKGGFVVLGSEKEELIGAVVVLSTGMGGYVPDSMILFASVDPSKRGKGYGSKILEAALEHAPGDIKLHVEYDNPAKRLYERLGFTNKYAEMRLKKNK